MRATLSGIMQQDNMATTRKRTMNTDALANRLEIAIDAERLLKGEPMSAHTTFKVGGPADFFASIASVDELVAVLDACRLANAPWHVIGCGSDLLVADEGIEGVCICLGEHFADIRVNGTRVIAQAGATNEQVAEAACEAGLSGYEFASGIPGSIGGAAIMNAGAYDGDRLVGFSYIECWEHGDYVATSGLIVSPDYRHMGLAARIKEKTFELARRRFPYAKIFSITTSLPVMKLNSRLGYVPVTFSELTDDETFWKGCEGCCNYDILQRNHRRMCLCTGMLYDPKQPRREHSRLAPYRMAFRNWLKKVFSLKKK